jgi:hypothetical protein
MSISDYILNKIKCCLNINDMCHVVNDPILLKCGGNACKQCVINSTDTMIKCFGCNGEHSKIDSLNLPKNTLVESVIHFFLNDLFKDINSNLVSITGLLKGFVTFC